MKACLFVSIFTVLLSACSSSKDIVVVYSPHGAEMLGDYERLFEAAYPEVDMQWLDLGSQEVYSRVSAERGRPAADVWWGAPSTIFQQAAKEGLFAPYRPTWADAVDEAFHDPDHLWCATFRSPLAILFNHRKYTTADMPKTWDELLDPKWRQKISLRQPLPSGTMRTFISAMIARAPSEDEGIAWLKQLHAATASYPESPNHLFDHLKKNEDRISVWLQPDIVMQRELNGFPFDYVLPEDTPVLTDGIAIIKEAPHPEWAKTFYEFVTTPEALAQQARTYAKMPARSDIDPDSLPDWMTAQEILAMPYDAARFAANEKAWCARWEREVYKVP